MFNLHSAGRFLITFAYVVCDKIDNKDFLLENETMNCSSVGHKREISTRNIVRNKMLIEKYLKAGR